jgi:hypothetical protein
MAVGFGLLTAEEQEVREKVHRLVLRLFLLWVLDLHENLVDELAAEFAQLETLARDSARGSIQHVVSPVSVVLLATSRCCSSPLRLCESYRSAGSAH